MQTDNSYSRTSMFAILNAPIDQLGKGLISYSHI